MSSIESAGLYPCVQRLLHKPTRTHTHTHTHTPSSSSWQTILAVRDIFLRVLVGVCALSSPGLHARRNRGCGGATPRLGASMTPCTAPSYSTPSHRTTARRGRKWGSRGGAHLFIFYADLVAHPFRSRYADIEEDRQRHAHDTTEQLLRARFLRIPYPPYISSRNHMRRQRHVLISDEDDISITNNCLLDSFVERSVGLNFVGRAAGWCSLPCLYEQGQPTSLDLGRVHAEGVHYTLDIVRMVQRSPIGFVREVVVVERARENHPPVIVPRSFENEDDLSYLTTYGDLSDLYLYGELCVSSGPTAHPCELLN